LSSFILADEKVPEEPFGVPPGVAFEPTDTGYPVSNSCGIKPAVGG